MVESGQDCQEVYFTIPGGRKLDAFNNSVQNLVDHGKLTAAQGNPGLVHPITSEHEWRTWLPCS
jgi:hypothetical protein